MSRVLGVASFFALLFGSAVTLAQVPDSETCSFPGAAFGGIIISVSDTIDPGVDLTVGGVEVTTNIDHSVAANVEITITSPVGTVVTLFDNSAGATSDISVIWSGIGIAHGGDEFTCGCLMQPSGPGTLADFEAQSSAGTWTLTATDSLSFLSGGTLDSWCLRLFRPHTPEIQVCELPAAGFGEDPLPASISQSIEVLDDIAIGEVEVYTDFTHAFIGDITTWITSPAGTFVTLYAEGGGSEDNLIVTWSDRGAPYGAPSYQCDCLMQPAGFEGLADFERESSAGTWTIDASDSFAASDGGTLDEVCLRIFRLPADFETCEAPGVAIGDIGLPESISETIDVTAAFTIFDTQVHTDFTHGFIGDIVASLTSPAGTTVTLYSEGGGASDDLIVTWSDLGVAHGAVSFRCDCKMQPSGPGTAADFSGSSSLGIWTLDATDSFPASGGGPLDEWCIRLYEVFPDLEVCAEPGASFGFDLLPETIVESTTVIDKLTVGEAEVYVDITHAFSGDVFLSVESPAGTVVSLKEASIGGSDDGVIATWSDRGVAYSTAVANCGCLIQPSGPGAMADLSGEPASGTWNLTATDTFEATGAGTIERWCVRIFESAGPNFLRGDCNADGVTNALIDALFILNWQFSMGAAPPCFDAADVNGDNVVNALIDALFLLNWQFSMGPAPPAPGPTVCGLDPDGDVAVVCATPPITCP
ncbi:MAG: proprotein convertase P-domain-containing protein [Planctomycetes bacterium]|nr:proprotein convertase P-domain-containing protein [Planctomycetota bacterium]